ncbi:lysoplasmalogenase family protein [Porphyrobacter sp. YT40]|uniref:lysoplasmalogenase family protein n=1 Tax=Porphyrobacter sp. YT40 TaxID=2547601 RepID=UPI001143DFEF|nr:lysoplasmalogenase family protein [Porphyrobacter sp. YT40]QDH34831.1 lysoplasmalogenase [Porphyrobacter sp. YT40]
MAKRALIEQRPWLLASVAAATAFYFLSDNPVFEGTWGLAAKGASVGLLALYVLLRVPQGRHRADGLLLAAALALAAAGDVAIELDFLTGGAFFAAAHVVAVALYLRNRHKRPSPVQKLIGAALLVGTPLVSWLLSGAVEIAIYAAFLGAMAASAWMSHYPRYRVGSGAVLFVLSDWLIFSRMGALDLEPAPTLLIWPLYYAGQLMIATGIVQCLRGEQPVR